MWLQIPTEKTSGKLSEVQANIIISSIGVASQVQSRNLDVLRICCDFERQAKTAEKGNEVFKCHFAGLASKSIFRI